MPPPSPDPDTIFAELLQDLPPETTELAREFKAFTRARKIKTPAHLLRAVLLFAGLDLTERAVAANLILVDPTIKCLSDQAVPDRLRACHTWLQVLLPRLLAQEPLPVLPSGLRWLVIDATDLTAPGQTKTTWRLQAVLDLVSLQLVCVHLTDRRTGETLCNFGFAADAVVITDRGYSHRRGVAHVLESGGQVIGRYNPHTFPVQSRAGAPLEVAEMLADCAPGERRTLAAQFVTPQGQTYEVWIQAYRLPGTAAEAARRRCRREGQKGGYTPKASTLWLSEFILILTSLPPEVCPPRRSWLCIVVVGKSNCSSSGGRACSISTSCGRARAAPWVASGCTASCSMRACSSGGVAAAVDRSGRGWIRRGVGRGGVSGS